MEFVFVIAIVTIVVIVFSLIFNNSSKVDKGFQINYFKLSYRRKFIRTLTGLPVVVFAVIFIYMFTDWSMVANVLIGVLFILLYGSQLLYNLYRWKGEEAFLED